MIYNEKYAEQIRQKLIKKSRFDIRSAFRVCDTNNDDYISASEVRYSHYIIFR